MYKILLLCSLISLDLHAGRFFRRYTTYTRQSSYRSTSSTTNQAVCPRCGRVHGISNTRGNSQYSLPSTPLPDAINSSHSSLTQTATERPIATEAIVPPFNTKSFSELTECQGFPSQTGHFYNGGAYTYTCPKWFGATLKIHGEITLGNVVRTPSFSSSSVAKDEKSWELTFENGKSMTLNPSEYLPGARIGSFHIDVLGKPNFISQKDESGLQKVKLVEFDVTGELGNELLIPNTTKEKIHNRYTSRFFIKVGDTPDETCIIDAIGMHAPETASLGRGYHYCEYVNNSSPRKRASHFRASREGNERANKIRENLLANPPSCKSVSKENLKAQALNFMDWPAPTEQLRGDGYWFTEYCDRSGNPSNRFRF